MSFYGERLYRPKVIYSTAKEWALCLESHLRWPDPGESKIIILDAPAPAPTPIQIQLPVDPKGNTIKHPPKQVERRIRVQFNGRFIQRKLSVAQRWRDILWRQWIAVYYCQALGCDSPILEALYVAHLPKKEISDSHTCIAWMRCECTECEQALDNLEPEPLLRCECALSKQYGPKDFRFLIEGLEPNDIELVHGQTGATRFNCAKALLRTDNDIVNAILALTE
jgi:hypothetical protein